MLARLLFAAGLALLAFMAEAADRRVLVVRDDGAVVRQAGDALKSELARYGIGDAAVAQFDLGELDKAATLVAALRRENAAIGVVALGPKAIGPAVQLSGGKVAVVAVVSRASLENNRYPPDQVSAIILDQPPDRLFNLVQVALPEVRQVGVLAGAATQKSLRLLEQRAQEHRLGLVSEAVGSSEELVAATERLVPKIRLLLAVPDPVVHSRNTILPLLLATYRAGVPVLAYSESYLQAGAAVALYSTPAQIAQQTAEVIVQVLEGRHPAMVLAPKYYTVGINYAVTRSLGLTLPAVSEIEQKLQQLEKPAAP